MRLLPVILALLLLCGCATVGDVTPPARPTLTAMPTVPPQPTPTIAPTVPPPIAPSASPQPTRTPEIARDCAWLGMAEVWLDVNLNGVREGGEPPLPSITIVASDGRVVLSGTTGADGRVELRTGLRGCTEPGLAVAAIVPSGYRLTTAATFTSRTWPTPYRFGLAPVAPNGGTPMRTAQP